MDVSEHYDYFRRRACGVVLKSDTLLMVCLNDSISEKQFWMPPGGGKQPGEEFWQCAVREVYEETGYPVIAVPETEVVRTYPFEWMGMKYLTETHFFLCELNGSKKATRNRESYITDQAWRPLKQVFEDLMPQPQISQAIYEVLQQRKPGSDNLWR